MSTFVPQAMGWFQWSRQRVMVGLLRRVSDTNYSSPWSSRQCKVADLLRRVSDTLHCPARSRRQCLVSDLGRRVSDTRPRVERIPDDGQLLLMELRG